AGPSTARSTASARRRGLYSARPSAPWPGGDHGVYGTAGAVCGIGATRGSGAGVTPGVIAIGGGGVLTIGPGGGVSSGPSILGGRFDTTPQPPGPHGAGQAHGSQQSQQSPQAARLRHKPLNQPPPLPPLPPNMEQPVEASRPAARVSAAKRVTIQPSFSV